MNDINRFCKDQTRRGISLKSSLIEFELLRRGVPYTRIGKRLLASEINGKLATFLFMNGPASSVGARAICDNKWIAHQLFTRNGLTVAKSQAFERRSFSNALEFARDGIGYPAVVKPGSSSRGNGVTTNIMDDDSFRLAWDKALQASRARMILVERQAPGDDFRLFVADRKLVSATWRRRASIDGDGKSRVIDLIESKNAQRTANIYLKTYPIPTDIGRLETLARAGRSLDWVPAEGEHVILRDVSNLSSGGDSIDVTDSVHPSFRKIAIAAIDSCPDMPYGGVDIIARDISIEATSDNHVVGEIEFSPAPLAHFPFMGKPRNMAGAILDFYLGT